MTNCTKVQYTSEEFALNDIKRIKLISKRSRQPFRTYYCKYCNFWHISSTSNKVYDSLKSAETELETLKAERITLLKTIKELKAFNDSEEGSLQRLTIRREDTVAQLRTQVQQLNKRVKQLTTVNKDLIYRNLQLEKQIPKS